MRHVRRHRAALLALLCVALSALSLLLAFDANAWRRTMTRDDLRFRALPSHRGLWKPSTTLPGDPAGTLLGSGDAIAYRRALQLFWFSRIGVNPEERQDLPTLRANTQQHLLALSTGGKSLRERSQATNLLGVLVVTTPTAEVDRGALVQILTRASAYFQRAIRMDPTNVDAKLNLELVLRLTKPSKDKFGRDARTGYGFGPGRGLTPSGSGY